MLRIPPGLLLIFLIGACRLGTAPLPAPPPPAVLEFAAPPAQVLKEIAAFLEQRRWSVLSVDTLGGQLQAEHTARGDGNGDWMVCEHGVGRRGDTRRATKELNSTVAVRVQTERTATGTWALITTTIPIAYSIFLFPERGPPEYARARCVSSGALESQLAAALQSTLYL